MKRKTYLKNSTIYQVYVRNHTKEGTFNALSNDLERIKELGVDILYLLPIHPLGVLKRKGKLGSPYAISDYYGINEEHGTLDDFKSLISRAHDLDLKVMIDIVLHHTSPDALLLVKYPEFYFYKDGKPGNKVGDWSDIIDLDYNNRDLWDYMLHMLTYWAKLGVDGFRADVAPLVPLAFWEYVRKELDKRFPNLIWLSESVEPGFLAFLHTHGHIGHSDKEMYAAFDILYDYDVYPDFKAFLSGDARLTPYIDGVKEQEVNYPEGYLKIRTIENHDTARIAALCKDERILRNVTAWSFFQNGVGFIYAGQEVKAHHTPTLFDKDTMDLTVKDQHFYDFIKSLIAIKKNALFSDYDHYDFHETNNVISTIHHGKQGEMHGFFNLDTKKVTISVSLNDGIYQNLLGDKVEVKAGKITVSEPIIILR